MILAKNISIRHQKDLRSLTENLSFTLNRGDKAAVIGEEGNGKSTLLQLIYFGQCPYATFNGNVRLTGRAEYLPQEIDVSLLNMTADEFFLSNTWFFDTAEKHRAALAMSMGFSKDIYYDKAPLKRFSGGERVKLQLLKIALSDADVLLLDEPASDIDLPTLVWLEEFIKNTPATVLYVSHDQTLVENTANVIIHLEQRVRKSQPVSTVFRGNYADYIKQRLQQITRSREMHGNETREFEKQIQRYQRIYQSVHHQQNAISRSDPSGGRLLKKKMHSVKALEKRLEKKKQSITAEIETEEAIMLDFVKTDFPKGKTVVDLALPRLEIGGKMLARDINLIVSGGQKVAITGSNGCGKTTLLKAIRESLLQKREIKTGYMPQHYAECMNFSANAAEYLADTTGRDKTTVRQYLGSVKFTADEMSHPIGELSGGQKAKLYFLSMILNGCNCLLLDEPTRNFSPLSNPVIYDVIDNFDGTIIAVSHDRKFLELFGRILSLDKDGLKEAE